MNIPNSTSAEDDEIFEAISCLRPRGVTYPSHWNHIQSICGNDAVFNFTVISAIKRFVPIERQDLKELSSRHILESFRQLLSAQIGVWNYQSTIKEVKKSRELRKKELIYLLTMLLNRNPTVEELESIEIG